MSEFERRMLAAARGEDFEEEPTPVAQEATQPKTTVYSGTYDSFFETLNDDEKSEFHSLFVNRLKGDFGLPVYQVGGDNSEFFSNVFRALGKFRKYISSGLLNKIYEYTNK